ncbi:MAG: hypothetical protein ACK5MT_16055 [Actinomycetales bacterium]
MTSSASSQPAGAGAQPKTFQRTDPPPSPPGTPAEIAERLTWAPRPPLELPRVDEPAGGSTDARHRLVVVGDSISQGFKSFAVWDTEFSWPAMVAGYGGIPGFRFPRFDGPPDCPGLPLNLEAIVRLIDWPGSLINLAEDAHLLLSLRRLMDDVEDYWERGPGADQQRAAPGAGGRDIGRVNHNLACWGHDVRDAMSLSVQVMRDRIATDPRNRDDLLSQIPSSSGERSGLLSLAGGAESDTQLSLARALGEDGGIETLVVALGANNILGTVLDFQVRWTEDGYDDVHRKGVYNAWLPSHFRVEFDRLLAEVDTIQAEKVIVLTVPHVTVAPMVRGVGTKMPGDRYFARYTRPWIPDAVFNPNRHPCLTGDQLRVLDFAVDEYNDHIVSRVRSRDTPGKRWAVLDICGVLDRLAYRRYMIDGEARPEWWSSYDLPAQYQALSPQPDTRFYRSDRFGRMEGGLVSLDGVHPTTAGYALLAREVMQQMTALGVALDRVEPDYDGVLAGDSLLCAPPVPSATVMSIVEFGNRAADLYQALRRRPPI